MKSATWLASISIVAQTLSAGCNSEGSFTTDSSLSRQDPYFRPPGRPPPAAPHQELSVDIDADPEALAEGIRVAHPAATEVTSDSETAFSFRVAPSFGGNCHVALNISVDIDFQASTNRILVSGYVLPSCVDPLTEWADVYFRILGDPGPSRTVTANASSSNLPSVDLIVLKRFVQVIYSLESPGGNPYSPLPGTDLRQAVAFRGGDPARYLLKVALGEAGP